MNGENKIIYGVSGGIGTGKTISLVFLALNDLYNGRHLYTNVKLKNVRKYKNNITYLTKDIVYNMFDKVKNKTLNMVNSTIIIQEAHNYIDSRNSNTIKNKMFSYFILMSRHASKDSGDILYDTQHYHQIDRRLRENTDFKIRPVIIERLAVGTKIVPSKIKLYMTGQVGHKLKRMVGIIDVLDTLDKYDTHELVDF